jgi:hypothetical protein
MSKKKCIATLLLTSKNEKENASIPPKPAAKNIYTRKIKFAI